MRRPQPFELPARFAPSLFLHITAVPLYERASRCDEIMSTRPPASLRVPAPLAEQREVQSPSPSGAYSASGSRSTPPRGDELRRLGH